MKKALSTLAVICLFLTSFAQTYPSAFAWPAAPGKDQKEQGPCHIFASISAIETWYDILFGAVPQYGISQTHPYSFCGNANQFPSTTIPDCLNFYVNTGGVDLQQLPYASGTPCTVGDGGSTAYFANQIKSGSTALVGGDCGTPYMNCSPNSATPSSRYRVANYSVLNIGAYTSNTQLKHAIMNYGPIPLWMMTTALHNNTSHAYCLYGWDANGNWLMTDSWPGLPNQGIMKTTLNIDSIFANGTFAAYILQNTTSHPAVYRQTYNGSAWSDDPNTGVAGTGFIPACSNAFVISGPSTITLSGNSVSVSNTGLIDNATITWQYKSSDGSSVSFNPATGPSTTATAGLTGTGTIYAYIKRPNGLCEQVKMATSVAVQGSNIPFTLTQTSNLCSGTTRSIQYVASSSYPLTCTWTLYPPNTNPPYTIINGCTFTMDFPQTPSSFGLHVAVTSSALPGAADGSTTGGSAMSCTGHMSTDSVSVTRANPALTGTTPEGIAMVPNPATGLLTIQLPSDRTYEIRIVNTLGATMQIRHSARAATPIDVSRLARGIYFVQIVDKTTGALTVKKVQLE